MKKILLVFASFLLIMGITTSSFAVQNSITLDSAVDASGDYSDGISRFFEAGTYEFSVVSGAWNPWFGSTTGINGVSGCDSFGANCDTGWIWSMDIYQQSTSTYFRLGSKVDRYESELLAYNAHSSDVLSLNQASDGNLLFFIKEGYRGDGKIYEWDNSGSVTASINKLSNPINNVVAPEPVSSLLFLVGGATMGFRCLRNKIKIG